MNVPKRKRHPLPDAIANEELTALFIEAKRRAVDRRDCRPATVNSYMANRYINQCVTSLSCASLYLTVEEAAAANLFLFGLVERGMRRQFKHVGKHAAYLVGQRALYLPEVEILLEPRFIEMMAVGLTESDVRNNGLLRLSVNVLPYAEDVVRRHLERNGLNGEKLFTDNASRNHRNNTRS